MSQNVLMEVRCIGPECKSCPELDLDVDRYQAYFDGRDAIFVTIFCKHYSKCERVIEHFRKNSNSDNEKDGV